MTDPDQPPTTESRVAGDGTDHDASAPTITARAVPWVARIAWLIVAVGGGAAIEAAVEDRSTAVRWTVAIGGWAAFGIAAAALIIPSVRSLTIVRVVTPLSLAAVVGVSIAGSPAADVGLLAVSALVACAACFSAEFGRWMVQASAYGDEARFPLRVPVAAGTAAGIAWLVWAASTIGGPLLLAAGAFIAGIPVALLAVAATVLLLPRWHRLSRRWFVLVPAGVVVHDPVVLADTLMVRTNVLRGLSLAPADTEAADLTGPAAGYAIEVTTGATVTTVLAFTPQEPNGRAIHMTAFLVAPSRPGEVLSVATARGLPVR